MCGMRASSRRRRCILIQLARSSDAIRLQSVAGVFGAGNRARVPEHTASLAQVVRA